MARTPIKRAPRPDRCTKIPLGETKAEARTALRDAQRGRGRNRWVPKRVYRCWCGQWHFTTDGQKPKGYGPKRS